MNTKKKILVIGAGASGLTSIKSCKEVGFEVVCYEKTANFGGIWNYNDESVPGYPSIMKFTLCNTSKEMNAFSDFPPPADSPVFMPHEVMLQYFEFYAKHFDLLPHIQYSHEVMDVSPSKEYDDNGQWVVNTKNLVTDEIKDETFDGVMVCTGHHSYPALAQYLNQDLFTGEIIHSHEYKSSKGYENKTVLVIGCGSSGTDVISEISRVAKKAYWSAKRSMWIYPRYMGKGKPFDVVLARRSFSKLPVSLIEKKIRNLLNLNMDHEKFGINPQENVLSQHPVVSDEIKLQLASGRIILKKGIREFTSKGVKFKDGDEIIDFDVVIFATGYKIKYPFLKEDILEVYSNNKIFLYKDMFLPQMKHPSLAFIGSIQPNGSLFPVFEIQARWFAALMSGACKLPDCKVMQSEVQQKEEFRRKQYVQTPRHTLEVDKLSYMDYIAEQIKTRPNMLSLMFRDPKLFWICFFGPTLSYQYRLNGSFKWEGARDAIINYKSRLYGHMSNIKLNNINTSEINE